MVDKRTEKEKIKDAEIQKIYQRIKRGTMTDIDLAKEIYRLESRIKGLEGALKTILEMDEEELLEESGDYIKKTLGEIE